MPTSKSFRTKFQDYLLQVSLIVLGLAIATSVDRCNTARRNEAKLLDYYRAIRADIRADAYSNTLNIADARNDVTDLDAALRLLPQPGPDSLTTGLRRLRRVLLKGVFRTFSPSTFDLMAANGDQALIRDLRVRNQLSDAFAFRNDILADDLRLYNQEVRRTLNALSAHLELRCFLTGPQDPSCLDEPTPLRPTDLDPVLELQLTAHSRLYHLDIGNELMTETGRLVDSLIRQLE